MGSPGAQGHPSLAAPACGGTDRHCSPASTAREEPLPPAGPGARTCCSPRPSPPGRGQPAGQPGCCTPCTGTLPWVLGQVLVPQLGSPGPSGPQGTGMAFLDRCPSSGCCCCCWQDLPKPCSPLGRLHSSLPVGNWLLPQSCISAPLAIQGTALSPSREPQRCQQPLSCWSMSPHPSLGRATRSQEPGSGHAAAACPCPPAGACGMWGHSWIPFVYDAVTNEHPKPWPRSTQLGWLECPTLGDTHGGVRAPGRLQLCSRKLTKSDEKRGWCSLVGSPGASQLEPPPATAARGAGGGWSSLSSGEG